MRPSGNSDSEARQLDLPACEHRGQLLPDGTARCRSSLVPKSPKGLVIVADICVGCRAANIPHPTRDERLSGTVAIKREPQRMPYEPLPCDYREDTNETEAADLWGLKGTVFSVYWCKLKEVKCVGFRICQRQQHVACATCAEREPKTFRKVSR